MDKLEREATIAIYNAGALMALRVTIRAYMDLYHLTEAKAREALREDAINIDVTEA